MNSSEKTGKKGTEDNSFKVESVSLEEKQHKKPKKRYDHFIFRDWCKKCGICSSFCPKNVIGRDEDGAPVIAHPEDCIGCRFCELRCPDFAITVREHPGVQEINAS